MRRGRLRLLVAPLFALGLGWAGAAFAQALAGAQTNTVAEMLRVGTAAVEDGLYGVAQKHLAGCLKAAAAGACDAGQAEDAVVLMLQVLHAQGRNREMLDFLESNRRWIRKETDGGVVPFWRAVALYEVGDAESALAELRDFEEQHPGSPYAARAQRLRASCHLKAGKLDEALDAFARFDGMSDDPAVAAENRLAWAQALEAAGRLDQAAAVLTQVSETATNPAIVFAGQQALGRVLVEAGRYDAAVPLLSALATNAAAAEDLRAEACFSLAAAYQAKTNTDLAAQALTNGIEQARNPDLKRRGGRGLGLLFLHAGRVDDAVARLKVVVAAAPEDPLAGETQLLLAGALLDRGRPEEAAVEYQHYLETFTNAVGQAEAYRGKGWGLLGAGRSAEAATAFLKARDLFSAPEDKARCLFKAGDAYLANGQFKLAGDTFALVIGEFPDSGLIPDALLQLGESRVRADDAAGGEKAFLSLAETHPDSPQAERALMRLAEMAASRGQWTNAVERFDQVVRAYSNGFYQADAMLGRAKASYRLKKFDEALRDFEALAARFPDDERAEEACYWSGLCYYWLGQEEKAAAVAANVVERYPGSKWAPRAVFWRAKYELNRSRYESAERQFLVFVDQYGTNAMAADALLWAGRSAAMRAEYLRAIELLSRLVKEYPDSRCLPEARFTQGDALANLAKFSDAILIFQEILTKYSASDVAVRTWLRKGDCEMMLGGEDPKRYEEALRSFGAAANHPNASGEEVLEAQYKIGRCLEKMNRLSEAIDQYYSKVVVRFLEDNESGVRHNEGAKKWFTRACYRLADIFEARKEWRQVVSILERMAEAGIPLTDETRARIQRLRADHWWLFY